MAENEAEEIEIRDEPDANRYEIRLDGDLAGFADYRLSEGRIIFPHTEIDSAFGGRGLGTRLVEFVVTDARRRELEIIPLCPFVKNWVDQNPEQT